MQRQQPYTGVVILDFTYDLGSYATRLFGDLGATVIRIEPEDGSIDRKRIREAPNQKASVTAKNTFAFRNASKHTLILNLSNEEENNPQIEKHLETAKLIFLERGGLFSDKLEYIRNKNPTAIITYISPYGRHGSSSHLKANDLTLQSAGGIVWMSGKANSPPLRLPTDQSAMMTSVYAAVASAAALMDTEINNRAHFIDVSAQECIAHSLQNALQVYDLEGLISSRNGEGTRDATEDIFPCKDGHMLLASPLALGSSWRSLLDWIKESENPAFDVLNSTQWLNAQWRKTSEAKQEFRKEFSLFIIKYSKKEILTQALQRKIVMAPINNINDVLSDEQLAYRSYFEKVTVNNCEKTITYPGAPYKFSENIWSISPPPSFTEA